MTLTCFYSIKVKSSPQKIRLCEADLSSAEAISIEESANEIASSCLLAKTILSEDRPHEPTKNRPPELISGSYHRKGAVLK